MRRALAGLLIISLLFMTGCGGQKKYSVTYYDTFDTVITITAYADSEARFNEAVGEAHSELVRLHNIFDRYNPHDGVNGVYAVNKVGAAPDKEIDKLLEFCDSLAERTNNRVDPRMGALLEVWHAYREQGVAVPDAETLKSAAIDRSKLDLGAVAKGYAVEQAAQLLAKSTPSYLINAGGNVRVGAAPQDGRDYWSVGVTDPGSSGLLLKLKVANTSVVTSGGYQRYYEVNGVRYHHIIDPDTLMPSNLHLQTTAITEDSALADYLSTALFLLPWDEGSALIKSMDGAEAIWVMPDGEVRQSDGIAKMILN